MLLKLQLRRAGNVAVLQCEGPIVSGLEAEYLEKIVNLELTEGSKHLVLEVGGVPRVDSGGVGLMVRLLMRARKAGGDLKLASPPAFVTNLLEVTRLWSVFEVFASAREAVMSYRNPTAEVSKPTAPKARIIFFDRSSDVCAFVRTVLAAHGYDVLSTTLIHDARVLLQVGKTDVLILGPNTSHSEFSGSSPVASLAAVAPTATVIELGREFQELDAEHAGTALLQLMAIKRSPVPRG